MFPVKSSKKGAKWLLWLRYDVEVDLDVVSHNADVTSFFNGPHPMLQKDAIGANATAVIKRSDFNADKHAPAVSDEVMLDIALEAVVQ